MNRLYRLADGHSLDELLEALCGDKRVFSSRHGHLARTRGWSSGGELGSYRPIEPLKSLLFQPRELVQLRTSSPESIAVGVKNCDLASLAVQDHVFLDTPPADPGYAAAREHTTIITSDCTDCLDVCFCTVVGQQPYARTGFDINISTVPEVVIEVGTERGEALLASASHMLAKADAALVARRDAQREAMSERVREQSAAAGLEPTLDLRRAIHDSDDEMWRELAEPCVECGACNFVCCTCHCFMLADGVTAEGEPARTRLWDACLFLNFARVAGGNPRPERASRLRNRFDKKFVFFKDRIGQYACNGCGRCTEVCTAGIDIRAVLRRAAEGSVR